MRMGACNFLLFRILMCPRAIPDTPEGGAKKAILSECRNENT